MQRLVRVLRALDVELVARRAVERGALVRADLGVDARTRAGARTRAARRPSSRGRGGARPRRGRAGGRCRRRGRDPTARRAGRSRTPARSPPARRAGPQRETPSSSSSRRLYASPNEPYDPSPPAETTRWHGTKRPSRLRAQKLPAARAAPGRAGERGELAVRHDLAARDRAQRLRAAREERRLVLEVERDVLERRPARRRSTPGAARPARSARAVGAVADAFGSSCQTTRPSSRTSSPTPQPSAS